MERIINFINNTDDIKENLTDNQYLRAMTFASKLGSNLQALENSINMMKMINENLMILVKYEHNDDNDDNYENDKDRIIKNGMKAIKTNISILNYMQEKKNEYPLNNITLDVITRMTNSSLKSKEALESLLQKLVLLDDEDDEDN